MKPADKGAYTKAVKRAIGLKDDAEDKGEKNTTAAEERAEDFPKKKKKKFAGSQVASQRVAGAVLAKARMQGKL